MTREELKRHCEKQIEECERWAKHKEEKPHGKIYEEHKLILELLEQEPCEDAVSRKAMLDSITEIDDNTNMDIYTNEVREIISALPSVTPTKCIATVKFSKEDMQELIDEKMKDIVAERKKGEWCKQNDDYFDWYECSECGYGSEGEMQYSSEYDVRTKYCPNCGAEMESEE